jgi:aminopeptidase YwaD
MNPVGGAAIPYMTGVRQIALGPTVFISGADSDRLRAMEGARARVRVGGRFIPGKLERNVVAELPGKSEEAVVVSAHHDSVWRGPGVIDNASGVEGVLRLAERFTGGGHARSLVFIVFAAEEIGCVGSRQYAFDADVTGELSRLKACVNLDCIAHGERFELNASPPPLLDRIAGLVDELGFRDRYDVNLGPASPGLDSFAFHEKGVPAASISHFPYIEYHTPSDVLELVDEARLSDSVELAARLIEGLLDDPVETAGRGS